MIKQNHTFLLFDSDMSRLICFMLHASCFNLISTVTQPKCKIFILSRHSSIRVASMAGKDFNDLHLVLVLDLGVRFLGVLVLARKLAGEQGRIQLQADDVLVLAHEVAVELGVTGLDCEVIQLDPGAEVDEVGHRPCPRVDVPRIDADPSRTHPVRPEEMLRIRLVVGVFHVVVGHGPIGRLADKGLDHAAADAVCA